MTGDRWRQPRTTSERRSEPWSRPPQRPQGSLISRGHFQELVRPAAKRETEDA
jgi:hypothetical protein